MILRSFLSLMMVSVMTTNAFQLRTGNSASSVSGSPVIPCFMLSSNNILGHQHRRCQRYSQSRQSTFSSMSSSLSTRNSKMFPYPTRSCLWNHIRVDNGHGSDGIDNYHDNRLFSVGDSPSVTTNVNGIATMMNTEATVLPKLTAPTSSTGAMMIDNSPIEPVLSKADYSTVLTPWEVLYPHFFAHRRSGPIRREMGRTTVDGISAADATTTTSTTPPTIKEYSYASGLHNALYYLKQSLERIVTGAYDPSTEYSIPSTLGDIPESPTQRTTNTIIERASPPHYHILRIQQPVLSSLDVDPLAWVHAQHQLLQQSPLSIIRDSALFYLADQENNFTVACIGAAVVVRDTKDVWSSRSLPPNTQWYGGQRFDTTLTSHSSSIKHPQSLMRSEESIEETGSPGSTAGPNLSDKPAMSTEWESFGKAYWMIPTIELVRGPEDGSTMLAVHLALPNVNNSHSGKDWSVVAQKVLTLLETLTEDCSPRHPPTTLPPVVRRDSQYRTGQDGIELYERAINRALDRLGRSNQQRETADVSIGNITAPSDRIPIGQGQSKDGRPGTDRSCSLDKVVLARLQKLHLGSTLTALDVLRRWRYGGHEGGHLFYVRPEGSNRKEFFGCTPERLFQIRTDGTIRSEALAGSRPRGSTQQADEELLKELLASSKEQRENRITGEYIEKIFDDLSKEGFIQDWARGESSANEEKSFFVRRLLHLQHICRLYSARVKGGKSRTMTIAKELLQRMHPTPAVCGSPMTEAREFIRKYETAGFDRGFYAGPIGYIGKDKVDIFVAIRSALMIPTSDGRQSTLAVYAGSGVVPGSDFQSEFSETNYKFAVVSSLFPPSPFTLQGAPTINVAWAASFVEELIRNGVTSFYVCPGSRSTPLVVAIARAARLHVGVVHAVSVHDERAAGFRAVGYARATGRPAAVITSSGTAVANLGPAVVEASQDGIPLLLLTADRPYESRNTGANQAIDQVKFFSESYIRWFRDILPPSDDVPVSLALSDANHAVSLAKQMRGPVHLNIQFRENLAPDAGPVRGDNRASSITKYDGSRFTDTGGFNRWSSGGKVWTTTYGSQSSLSKEAVHDIVRLIEQSERGLIVVGNIRAPTSTMSSEDVCFLCQTISNFAMDVGFPVFAGAQSGSLRFRSEAVVPFAEHLLKNPIVAENLKPDLVIQIGAPLVSSQIPLLISQSLKANRSLSHVLIHPGCGSERSDPEFTVSHHVSSEIGPFLKAVQLSLRSKGSLENCHSQLAPLVLMGRRIQQDMKNIIRASSDDVSNGVSPLTEPEIALALAEISSDYGNDMSLFISNSMPIRDAEFFFYPYGSAARSDAGPKAIGTNRGASGIDGIISSSIGFTEAIGTKTALVIGDLSALHDLNSMHSLTCNLHKSSQIASYKRQAMTTVVVNNDGGGIFSFLPIAKHGSEVGFEEFFGTPTNGFSFAQGAKAFGLPYMNANTYAEFTSCVRAGLSLDSDCVIEATVVGRDQNVAVHRNIANSVDMLIGSLLSKETIDYGKEKLPIKEYSEKPGMSKIKTLVLLHGWMGDKTDWDPIGSVLGEKLGTEWRIIAIDLPGHGASLRQSSSELSRIRAMLTHDTEGDVPMSLTSLASTVLSSLSADYGIEKIDAIAAYSLGGRVALEMQRICRESKTEFSDLIGPETASVLLSVYPGDIHGMSPINEEERYSQDSSIASRIDAISDRSCLRPSACQRLVWLDFLEDWYGGQLWGTLKRKGSIYGLMLEKRAQSLSQRGLDLSKVLLDCSPSRSSKNNWRFCNNDHTLFIAGSHDKKYAAIGSGWSSTSGVSFIQLENAGHALLAEAPIEVSNAIEKFLSRTLIRDRRLPAANQYNGKASWNEIRRSGNYCDDSIQSPAKQSGIMGDLQLDSLEFENFSIELTGSEGSGNHLSGIGWGNHAKSSAVSHRTGLIIQLRGNGSRLVGLGEVSPLPGLHTESLEEVKSQVIKLQKVVDGVSLNSKSLLQLQGGLVEGIKKLAEIAGVNGFHASLQSGLEMALLSLAAQQDGTPIHQALIRYGIPEKLGPTKQGKLIPINGLITRFSTLRPRGAQTSSFQSVKVKVGHQSVDEDKRAVLRGIQEMELSGRAVRIRADANRSWNESQAVEFAASLAALDVDVINRLEYVEEPITKISNNSSWSLEGQVDALERWYRHSDIAYALDESIADLADLHNQDFESIKNDLRTVFLSWNRGCACFVLKPTRIGLELSIRIARLAREELGIAAVFSSSFDSGLGLAHTSFLALLSDLVISRTTQYAHGLGTYLMLKGDVLIPSFSTYVSNNGLLNAPSLSRAIYGLSLEEIRDSPITSIPVSTTGPTTARINTKSKKYEASAATSQSGKDISVVASLPLPFSAEIACSRFTDLPQQSRWCPWISSVTYHGVETEWTVNFRGVPLTWRATSSILRDPWPGIEWQSVSGLKNRGSVEFIPDSPTSCHMNVRMEIVPPRLLQPIFQGTSVFLEEFLREKLVKWSLEMFRDSVKADLAVERGDVELGDALIDAVEVKASAIEATLVNLPINK